MVYLSIRSLCNGLIFSFSINFETLAQEYDGWNPNLKTVFVESKNIIKEVLLSFPIDSKLVDFVTREGARTDFKLRKVYEKCVSQEPQTITIGAVGGSITTGVDLGNDSAYPYQLSLYLQKICRTAKLKVINASQNATGSLTAGLCLASLFNGEDIDIFLIDFTLNDGIMYKFWGKQDNAPYELLIRNAITKGLKSQPAIFSLYFWANGFKNNYFTQRKHMAIATNYEIAGISMNDLVLRFINRKVKGYNAKEKIVIDGHHPNKKVHKLAAGLLSIYIARLFLEFALEEARNTKQDKTQLFEKLPEPLNQKLNRFDLEADRSFRCEMTSKPSRIPIAFTENNGWAEELMIKPIESNADSLVCYIPETSDAYAIWEVEIAKDGFVIVCNCRTTNGAITTPPSFQVEIELKVVSGNETKSIWRKLNLKRLIGRIGECFEAEHDVIDPGFYRLRITPSPLCRDEWEVKNPVFLDPPDVVPCNQTRIGIKALVVL